MAHVFRYKSFEEERKASFEQMFERDFEPKKWDESFVETSLPVHIYYAPGVYRYRSFEEARKDDLERIIKYACTKTVNKSV